MKLFELVTNGGPGAGSESVDIFHTTDSGQTWSKIASTENPASGLPRVGLKSGISFRDAMHGWATGGDYSDTPIGMRAKRVSRALHPLAGFGESPNTSFLLFCRRRRQEKGSAEGFPLLNAHAYGRLLRYALVLYDK